MSHISTYHNALRADEFRLQLWLAILKQHLNDFSKILI